MFYLLLFSTLWSLQTYFTIRLLQMFGLRARSGFLLSILFNIFMSVLQYKGLIWGVIFYHLALMILLLPWMLLLDGALLVSRYRVFKSFSWLPNLNLWHFYQHHKPKVAIGIITGSLLLFSFAHLQFHRDIAIEHITIYSNKVKHSYNLLHITDVQLGSVSPEHVKKIAQTMTQAINQHNVDLIVNTGDQVDRNNFTAEQLSPIVFNSLTTLFSYGNHDLHRRDLLQPILELQNQIVLGGSSTEFKELNIIGLEDSGNKQHVDKILTEQSLVKPDKYNILMYHRPVGVRDAKKHGIDLMLSGHTHGGQIFPITLIVKWLYEFPQGFVQLDNFSLYTSDGVGLWGPNLRLGTRNEMAVITIKPSK